MPPFARRARPLAAVLLLAAACTSTSHSPRAGSTTSRPAAGRDAVVHGQWTTYANGNQRLGVAGPQPADPDRRLWSAPLDGSAVYAQPLIYGGRVFAVTEKDGVYALDAASGRVQWKVQVGQPLRNVASHVGCGNIDPLGITSTPVIDTATNTLYVVAEVSAGGAPPVSHRLVGLDIRTGRQVFSADADPPLPPGEGALQLLQRGSLALSSGRVYIGYGGHYGDCGTYHGWVVGMSVAGGAKVAFDVTPDSTGGAVWQGGAGPSVDTGGNLYITTGNPNSGGPAPYAEAVVKLSPTLSLESAFQDRAATDDADLGAGDAALLPDGTVFAAGKTMIGYLLRQGDLSPVAPIAGKICGSDPDGGTAFDAATDSVYLPCRDGGIQQVDLANRRTGWRAGDVNSTPILANGSLWALAYPDGTLEQMDPRTGTVSRRLSTGRPVPNFASPAIAGGVLVAGTKSGVVAFGR